MRRIGLAGLLLLAMFAFGSMGASAAQAVEVRVCVKSGRREVTYDTLRTTPHRGTLVKRTKSVFDGHYTDRKCQTPASSLGPGQREGTATEHLSYEGPRGKYEWASGSSAFTSEAREPRLIMNEAGNIIWGADLVETEITCDSSTGTGEWTGTSEGTEQVVYKGCKLSTTGSQCTSEGQAAGEIETSPLDFKLIGYPEEWVQAVNGPQGMEEPFTKPNGPIENRVWAEYREADGSVYAEYTCGANLMFRTLGTPAGKVEPSQSESQLETLFLEGEAEMYENTGLYSEYSGDGGTSWVYIGPAHYRSETIATEAGKTEIIPTS